MFSPNQALDAIEVAAKSEMSDEAFRALVLVLLPVTEELAKAKSEAVESKAAKARIPKKRATTAMQRPAPTHQATTYYYKLFRVRRADGSVTTVSVDPVLVTKAMQVLGGPKQVGALVRELASQYVKSDSVRSCSRFVGRGILAAMTLAAGKPVNALG